MIHQLVYTSCRHGRDGIAGFQVAASTPGIPARYEDLCLPLAAYRPPPAAPAVPTPPEIDGFPVAFGYRDLGEIAVLFRSHYLGEDFSGRQGNYLAHLVLTDRPEVDLAPYPPAAAWGSPFWWRDRLPPDGDATLPPVTSMSQVFGAAPRQPVEPDGTVLPVLRAVRDGLAGRARQVVVVADGPDPAAAVAAVLLEVTTSLPGHLARQVSFSTFSAHPADVDLLVVGVTPDVPLGPLTGDGREIVRLGRDTVAASGAYEALLQDRRRSGAASLTALTTLADQVRPGLDVGELDAFAAAVPLLDEASPTMPDPLGGLEFLAARHPAGLGPGVWERLETGIALGTVRFDDLDRWSALLSAVPGHRPALDAAHLRAALTRVTTERGPDPLWLPTIPPDAHDGVVAWAVAAVERDPDPQTTARTLRTLEHLQVRAPDADLRAVVEAVLIPVVLDPQGDVEPFRGLQEADRLARITAGMLDERLDDERVPAVADGLTTTAARWLLAAAGPRSRTALAADLCLAAAGARDPVDVVVAHAVDAATLDRLLPVVWPGVPPAADGVRLLDRLDPDVLSASALPAVLAPALTEDRGHSDAVTGLANRLDARRADLDESAQADVDAVLIASRLRRGGRSAGLSGDRITRAAHAAARAHPSLARQVVLALVHRLFADDRPLDHAQVLDVGLAAGVPGLADAYGERLERALARADPIRAAGLLQAVADVSRDHQAGTRLLSGPCARALSGRRRRTVDEIGIRLSAPEAAHDGLTPPLAPNWAAWWNGFRSAHVTPSPDVVSGLRRWFGRR